MQITGKNNEAEKFGNNQHMVSERKETEGWTCRTFGGSRITTHCNGLGCQTAKKRQSDIPAAECGRYALGRKMELN